VPGPLAPLDARRAARLALHGALVTLAGLLVGFPYAMVVTGELAGEERAWRMAHLEGVLNGLLMLAAAAVGGRVALRAGEQRALVVGLILAGWGNVVAATLAALHRVRGLEPAGPLANLAVFALFTAAVVGVLVAVALLALGAARAARGAGAA
jgi:hypothetical protein